MILGFDFGLRYTGVAIGQTITCTAQPLPTLLMQKGIPNWQEIDALITAWRPCALVVGWPLTLEDAEQPINDHVRGFIDALGARSGLPVYTIDERLSSKEAHAQLFAKGGYRALQKQSTHSVAAVVILESWLASREA